MSYSSKCTAPLMGEEIVHAAEMVNRRASDKGFVQLAMRSGQYQTLNAGIVCEGQIKEIDFVTGEIIRGEKISDNVVGYVAYMRLVNGFEKSLYMTVEELREHAAKYSQSYAYDQKTGKQSSPWTTHFDAMAKKTVLKQLLSRFGVISIDQQSRALTTALKADQAVITEDGFRYVDNERGEERIVPFGDVIELPEAGDVDDTDNPDENNQEENKTND